MKRFSKLKKQLENLFESSLDMQFCCNSYPMRSTTGYAHNSIPRFYIKLGKEIIWDYPKDFYVSKNYAEWSDNNGISSLVREYIDTPIDELLNKRFNDEYKLTDIFKAADKRTGYEKLVKWATVYNNPIVCKILIERYQLKRIPVVKLSFHEMAIIGIEMLSRQEPVTLEEMRAQSTRVRANVANNKKKR